MLLQKKSIKLILTLPLFFWSFILFAQTASAASVSLFTNTSSIVNGETVTLEWSISGDVSNCSINDGSSVVYTVDISTLPTTGSTTLVPPSSASTNYTLNCDGTQSSVIVSLEPVVTLSIDFPSLPAQLGFDGFNIDGINMSFSSQYATECGLIWYEYDSLPGTRYWLSSGGFYGDYGDISGTYDANSGFINGDATFYIECTNDNGDSGIGAADFDVINPNPPGAITTGIYTNTPTVTLDPNTGSANAVVGYNSTNAAGCSTKNYREDGTEIEKLPGFGYFDYWYTSMEFEEIRISETMDFEVTCTRPELTINGVTYPPASQTDRVRVTVTNPLIDSSTLPNVDVVMAYNPDPVYGDPISGSAIINVYATSSNADYCLTESFYLNNGNEYYLDDWTEDVYQEPWHRRTGNGTFGTNGGNPPVVLNLATSTTLRVECRRHSDWLIGWDDVNKTIIDPVAYARGVKIISVDVPILTSLTPPPDLNVSVYGNAVYYSASDVYDNSLNNTGWAIESSQRRYLYAHDGDNDITFVFNNPYSTTSDTYDISLKYCDISNGTSDFTISVSGQGEVGYWSEGFTPNKQGWCDSSNLGDTYVAKTGATNVTLNNGDEITLSCTENGNEQCQWNEIVFGSRDSVIEVTPVTPTANVEASVYYIANNATVCNSATANPASGANYQWSNVSDGLSGYNSLGINQSTQFSINCSQNSIVQNDSVNYNFAAFTALTASTTISAGDCKIIDPTAPDGLRSVEAPIGFMADENNNNICVPAVDLIVPNTAFAEPDADNYETRRTGLYQLANRLVIGNIGEGALPESKDVTYKSVVSQLNFGFSDIESDVDYFDGPLTSPTVDLLNSQSPTLTIDFAEVPFGPYRLCSTVNKDKPLADLVPELDFDNNTGCIDGELDVPEPPLVLNADRTAIRRGQTVDLSYGVDIASNAVYSLDCGLVGFPSTNFDPSTTPSPTAYAVQLRNMQTNPINSTTEFVLSCYENNSGITFLKNLIIDVVPDYEEI